jgi:two-component system, chemotaxis family, CheB/CheR fusion protein
MSSDQEQSKRPSVLVVDDNHDAADSTCFILNHMGYPSQVAYDASRALQLARARAPQVVLLDLAMPGGNGLGLAQELRRLPETNHALLICISGFASAEDRRLSREAGCDHHLLKPFDWVELLRLLDDGRAA